MKIVCDSCSAKYSIADEKVAGKTFKIRCRKCNAPILVDGTSVGAAAPQDEEATTFDANVMAVWHVVMGGEQKGPFPLGQLGAHLDSGEMSWDDYVWKEGFADWKAAKDVPELAQAFGEGASDAGSSPGEERASESGPQARGSSAVGVEAARASSAVGDRASSTGGIESRASSSVGSAGGGMFGAAMRGSSAASGSSASSSGGGMFPASTASAGSMTGQRGENSVLFSLNNLQNLAGQSNEVAAKAKPTATTEGSGLIDIRSIAEAAAHTSKAEKGGGNDIDDLLSLGGGAMTFASPLTAPVVDDSDDEPVKKSKAPMAVMVSAAVIAASAAVAALAFVFSQNNEPDAAEVAATTAQDPALGTQAAAAEPTGTDSGEMEAPGGTEEPAAAGDSDQEEEEEAEGSKTASKDGRSGRSRGRSGRSSKSSGSSSSKSASTDSSPSKASSGSSSGKKSGGGDIDSLLEQALGGKKSSGGGGGSGGLPETPSRNQVLSALKRVAPGVKACGGGKSGVVNAKVTVQGSSGRVSGVSVSGQFAGTPVASCAARVIKRARFPKFKKSTFVISRFPYKI